MVGLTLSGLSSLGEVDDQLDNNNVDVPTSSNELIHGRPTISKEDQLAWRVRRGRFDRNLLPGDGLALAQRPTVQKSDT